MGCGVGDLVLTKIGLSQVFSTTVHIVKCGQMMLHSMNQSDPSANEEDLSSSFRLFVN